MCSTHSDPLQFGHTYRIYQMPFSPLEAALLYAPVTSPLKPFLYSTFVIPGSSMTTNRLPVLAGRLPVESPKPLIRLNYWINHLLNHLFVKEIGQPSNSWGILDSFPIFLLKCFHWKVFSPLTHFSKFDSSWFNQVDLEFHIFKSKSWSSGFHNIHWILSTKKSFGKVSQ